MNRFVNSIGNAWLRGVVIATLLAAALGLVVVGCDSCDDEENDAAADADVDTDVDSDTDTDTDVDVDADTDTDVDADADADTEADAETDADFDTARLRVRIVPMVSDQDGAAPVTDPHLVNAWGIASGPTTAFWIADNGTGLSTVYDTEGQPFPAGGPLVVTIPAPAAAPGGTVSAPTGIVFNSTTDFEITEDAVTEPATFIFATEDGTIAGWNAAVNPDMAIRVVDDSATDAVYKGIAIAAVGADNFVYVTDFHNNSIDAYDTSFESATLAGTFTDPDLPAGFAPFGIANIGGQLYVTYAQQDADAHDDVAGAGLGYVDIYDPDGTLVGRFASQGVLNAPWAVIETPAEFSDFGGMIVVGNFGDGHISVFDTNGALMGQLNDGTNPIAIDGLWGLIVGNGGEAGDADTLYFTSGPNDEANGLFGALEHM